MGVDLSSGHEAMDYGEHEKTYSLFVKLAIVLAVVVLTVLAFLGLFFT